jgi:hypothetical protein
MPDLTKTKPDPSLSPFKASLFDAITILFYAIFLAIQTMRHRSDVDLPSTIVGFGIEDLGAPVPLGGILISILLRSPTDCSGR